jgi:hypothetical protein
VSRVRRQLIIAGFTVLACGLLLGGLMIAGKLARNALQTDERYQFPFKAIECPAPPGLEREAFLGEVRYLGEFPESVPLLDDALPARLTAAFVRHPWVERVDKVDVGPGRRLAVRLTFRTPILGVIQTDRVVRAVDASGILLPRGADTLLLPHISTSVTPAGPGKPWGDPHVERAAAVAALLRPHQERVKLTDFRWEGESLQLRREGAKSPVVIWGDSNDGERKLQRLLAQASKLDTAKAEIDLRKE